jgi:hypothetical protein
MSELSQSEIDKTIIGVARVGEVKQREVGVFIEVVVSLRVRKHAFKIKYYVRREWFDADFAKGLELLDKNNRTVYAVNMQRITRGVFEAAGMRYMDFNLLVGKRVGFIGHVRSDGKMFVENFFIPANKQMRLIKDADYNDPRVYKERA